MFAYFAQETGGHESWRDTPEWRQALVYLREVGWVEGQKGGYNGECNPDVWQGQTWPCGKDKDGDFLSYFGRGAKQLSDNYGPFSDAMYGGDVRPLLDKPELVADTWMNLASAVLSGPIGAIEAGAQVSLSAKHWRDCYDASLR